MHRMFQRVNQRAGTMATLHSLRYAATYRMAEEPAVALTDVQYVLGHAAGTTTQPYLTAPQRGRGPPRPGASRAADPAGHPSGSGPCRARYRPEALQALFGSVPP